MSDNYTVPVIAAEEFQDRGQVEILTRLSSELLSLLQQTNPLMAQYIEQIRNQASSQLASISAEASARKLRGHGELFIAAYKATTTSEERIDLLNTLPRLCEPNGDSAAIKNYLLRQVCQGSLTDPAKMEFLDSIPRKGDQKALMDQLSDENVKWLDAGIYTLNQSNGPALEVFAFITIDTWGIRHYYALTKQPGQGFFCEHQILMTAEKAWVADSNFEYTSEKELAAQYPRVKGLFSQQLAANIEVDKLYRLLEERYEQGKLILNDETSATISYVDASDDIIKFTITPNPETGLVAVKVDDVYLSDYDYNTQLFAAKTITEQLFNADSVETPVVE